jgi:hypothetical protein
MYYRQQTATMTVDLLILVCHHIDRVGRVIGQKCSSQYNEDKTWKGTEMRKGNDVHPSTMGTRPGRAEKCENGVMLIPVYLGQELEGHRRIYN